MVVGMHGNVASLRVRIIVVSFLFALFAFNPLAGAQQPWSDPGTWGGSVPVAGENVVIPVGQHVLLDTNTPDLGGVTVHGTLEFGRQDLQLTADWIVVTGVLQIGSQVEPFSHQAVITLNANDPNENIMGMGTRGIMAMGGNLEMHGSPPSVC